MPTRSQKALRSSTTTRLGRDIRPRTLYGHEEVPVNPANVLQTRTSKEAHAVKRMQPRPAATQSKRCPPKEKAAAVEEAIEDSEASEEESEEESGSSMSSESYVVETEDIDTSKGYNVPYDGASRKTLYSRWILVKAENRQKDELIEELEDTIRHLEETVCDDGKSTEKFQALQIKFISQKDELERLKLKNAALRKDVADLKAGDSGAVASLQLQHRKVLYDEAFKLKNAKLDLIVERRRMKEAEDKLVDSEKTVEKLRRQ